MKHNLSGRMDAISFLCHRKNFICDEAVKGRHGSTELSQFLKRNLVLLSSISDECSGFVKGFLASYYAIFPG